MNQTTATAAPKRGAKAIVHCNDYNGHQAYFVMRKDDERFDTANYVHIIDGTKRGSKFFDTDGRVWTVFADWSARYY